MVWPKPEEVAVVTVNGTDYRDWETVMVRHALRDVPAYHCRFTCSEFTPIARNFSVMQIKPGDVCSVTLAGLPAFLGRVETRQVYYDAKRHHIEIQCASNMDVATASVIHSTMEWKNKTFQQIGQEILNNLGIKMTFEGGSPPGYTFPRISAAPGENVHDFLDTIARGLSQQTGLGISFTSNEQQDFVVAMGPLSGGDSVIEGRNILIGREIIYNPAMAGNAPVIAQSFADDQNWGAKVASQPFFNSTFQTFGSIANAGVIVNELPTFDKTIMGGRNTSEKLWQQGDQITVFATVYGWLRPSGGLWRRNQNVNVDSPMLIMHNQSLIAKSVTFTQDDDTGTRTTLELCNPAALGGLNPPIQN